MSDLAPALRRLRVPRDLEDVARRVLTHERLSFEVGPRAPRLRGRNADARGGQDGCQQVGPGGTHAGPPAG